MPKKALAEIIARALSDPGFRKKLIQQPNKALAGYDLTTEEIALIASSLAKDQAADPARELDKRVSQARLPLGFLGDAARLVVDAEDMPDMPVLAEAEQPDPAAELTSGVTTRKTGAVRGRPTEATATLQDEKRESSQQCASAGTEDITCADPTGGADPETSCGGASEIEGGG